MNTLIFKQIEPLESDVLNMPLDKNMLCEKFLSLALYSDTPDIAKNKIYSFFKVDDLDICRCAILAIGHLARLHKNISMNEFMEYLSDVRNKSELKGVIEDVIDDITIFCQKNK
ncbi:hypothetical protein RYD26_12430 [Pasteurellaceae bacterium LIM206]|nr:hypothetical protein [Pasteurellaceae bacterium LIM206]